MKLVELVKILSELILSFVIKQVVQVNLSITGNTKIDSVIYGVVSYGLILLSLINLLQVFIAHKKGTEKKKIGFFANLGIYSLAILVAVGLWQLINFWVFWVVIGVIAIIFIIYYIKNAQYKKEIQLYKKSIRKAIQIEYDFTVKRLKIYKSSENFILILTDTQKYYLLALPTEEITRDDEYLNTLNEIYAIKQTEMNENYVLLRYLSFFVLENENDLVPLYIDLTNRY